MKKFPLFLLAGLMFANPPARGDVVIAGQEAVIEEVLIAILCLLLIFVIHSSAAPPVPPKAESHHLSPTQQDAITICNSTKSTPQPRTR